MGTPMKQMKIIGLTIGLILAAGSALGQAAIEHHVWQDARYFTPYSRTATAITGPIYLSGNAEFATPGSRMNLRFANGTDVELISEGGYWRNWEYGSEHKQTAEVFRATRKPAELLNGNMLCDGAWDMPIFFVFHEFWSYSQTKILSLSVFQLATPPIDINSEGLCGTFNYDAGIGQ